MSSHLNDEQLINYAYRTLTDTQRETIDLHLKACQACRARLEGQDTLQRRIHYSVMTRRKRVNPSSQMTFAAIAPNLKRSRRFTMFVKQSNQILYGAVTLVILILLAVGLITLFGGVNQPSTGPNPQIPTPAETSNPSLTSTPVLNPTPAATAIEPAMPPQNETQMEVIKGYMEVDGINLYYEMVGSGPPLVLLHDAILHREVWDAQFKALAQEGYTVIRYDRRGYGLSETDPPAYVNIEDLRALLQFLNVDSVTLIGSSYGGQMAIDFTLAYPDLVDALVVVGAPLGGSTFSNNDIDSMAWRIIVFKRAIGEPPFYRIDDTDKVVEGIDRFTEYLQPYWIAPQNTDALERARVLLKANPQNLTHPRYIKDPLPVANGRLPEIQAPTLIIVGELDSSDLHEHADKLETGIAGAKKVIIPNAGHLVHLEQPEAFNQAVLDFLQRR